MLRKNKSKTRPKDLSVEEFLQLRPKRADYEYHDDEAGLVHIRVPKFEGDLGRKWCQLLRRDECFTANMDELGSLVWKAADGNRTVAEILEILKKNVSDQENLDQRLFLFLRQMRQLRYFSY